MANKADVKAMMARFQGGGTNGSEEKRSSPAGRHATALHPTQSSGPPLQPKKPVLESLSGSAFPTPPKPNFLKSTVSASSAPEVQESPHTKVLASRFSNTPEDGGGTKPAFGNKKQPPFKTHLSQEAEARTPKPKPPLHKPSLSSTLPESKPAFPKPPLAGVASKPKPPWVKDDNPDPPSTPGSTAPKAPPLPSLQRKPSSSITRLRTQHNEANADTALASKPPPISRTTPHAAFNRDWEKPQDVAPKAEQASKLPLSPNNSTPPPKPLASKKPSFLRKTPAALSPANSADGDAASAPMRKPLPNIFSLGPAPAKPNRPPRVSLGSFRTDNASNGDATRKTKAPLLPASHPGNHSNHAAPAVPSSAPAPSLPPRHPGAIIQPDPEENYDDVGVMNSPPPLPPSTGHPSNRAMQEEESDGEMYEDLDELWEASDLKEQEKKREKEEKKRLELEKKEQKEREKKEQDTRKKFKLVGPLEVMHKVKALVETRGSKTDLTLKPGDWVDVLRVQGNPEGKWLGRTQNGTVGYVKTDSVEIDLDSWKQQMGSLPAQNDHEPELYDDIDCASEDHAGSPIKGPGVVLPPPPEEEGELYDDVLDPSLDVSRVPPPSQFTADGVSAINEEIYDDVDSQIPAPPPVSSLPTLKAKSDDIDPKRQKKMEKEEKDFRKKFKYEGEIQVLYQVTAVPTLTCKKWSGKELPVKPGEQLDVIVKAVDNKLLCRNDEGKYGYVSTSHIVMEGGDIYDDIGDDGIYDND